MIVINENINFERPVLYETLVGELYINSFKYGTLSVSMVPNCHIEDFAIILAQAVDEIKNVEKISFNFNNKTIEINKQAITPKHILNICYQNHTIQ